MGQSLFPMKPAHALDPKIVKFSKEERLVYGY